MQSVLYPSSMVAVQASRVSSNWVAQEWPGMKSSWLSDRNPLLSIIPWWHPKVAAPLLYRQWLLDKQDGSSRVSASPSCRLCRLVRSGQLSILTAAYLHLVNAYTECIVVCLACWLPPVKLLGEGHLGQGFSQCIVSSVFPPLAAVWSVSQSIPPDSVVCAVLGYCLCPPGWKLCYRNDRPYSGPLLSLHHLWLESLSFQPCIPPEGFRILTCRRC